jgi:hypothetical protein
MRSTISAQSLSDWIPLFSGRASAWHLEQRAAKIW